jgi:hypothetical protein
VLDGIDDIDWASVHHAYGPAVDVPGDLRDLLAPDRATRGAALHRLYGSIFHQGTRWRASRLAVPFLTQLASDATVQDRHTVVELIGHLAVGYHEAWLDHGVDSSELMSGDAEFAAGNNEFHMDELDVYRSVCREASRLLSLCADDDPSVRHATSYLLGFLPDIGDDALGALVERAKLEETPKLRANALIALALLAQSLDRNDPIGFDRFLDWDDPAVTYAAATGRARLAGPGSDTATRRLIEALTNPPDVRLYWNEGDLIGFAATTLRLTAGGFSEEVVATLCGLLRRSDGPAAERLVGPLLANLFPAGSGDVPQFAADLRPAQRRLVETLAESPRTWSWNGMPFANFSLTVRGFGLPGSAADVERYLGGEPLDQTR